MSESFYSGVEPVEVGDMSDVKETRTIIPATKNVRLIIRKAENRINKDNTYRQIHLELGITDGIGEEGKFKKKVIFTNVCYFADPIVYTKEFFTTRQHLVQLKYLFKATGITATAVDGHVIDQLMQSPVILADITIRKRPTVIDGEDTVLLENDVRNFKPVPAEQNV